MSEITLEQVEKIRLRANVSYEEAKAALEASDGDLLEAMIYLERRGKAGAPPPADGFYSTRAGADPSGQADAAQSPPVGGGAFWNAVLRVLRCCTTDRFEVWRAGQLVVGMPVLILILLLIVAAWVTGPLLLIGLLGGWRYRFSGPDLGRAEVNAAIEQIHRTVDAAVAKVKGEFDTNPK